MSALHTLVLRYGYPDPDVYGALERLPRLRRLHIKEQDCVPACLSSLTGLEELVLDSLSEVTDAMAAELDAALRPLTGLTSL